MKTLCTQYPASTVNIPDCQQEFIDRKLNGFIISFLNKRKRKEVTHGLSYDLSSMTPKYNKMSIDGYKMFMGIAICNGGVYVFLVYPLPTQDLFIVSVLV